MAEPTCEHAGFQPTDYDTKAPGPECPYREKYQTLTPVGMFCAKGASVYGLCDMAGNVAASRSWRCPCNPRVSSWTVAVATPWTPP